MDEIRKILQGLEKRIETLERKLELTKITVPTDGKLVVDSQSSDPATQNGRIYYNTATNKYKVCENGVWKTLTSS